MPAPIATIARPIPRTQASEGPPLPEPGFFDTLLAGARTAQDESSDSIRGLTAEGYQSLADALGETGVERSNLTSDQPWWQLPAPGGSLDRDKVWAAVEARRGEKRFADLPKSREEYELWLQRRRGGRDADQRLLSVNSHPIAGFIGSSLGDMADSDLGPLQFAVGAGGKTIVMSAVREGLLNSLLEVAKTPERLNNREALGEPMSTGEIALNIAGAAVLPGALTVAGRVAVRPVGRVLGQAIGSARGDFERTVAAIWPVLPEKIRARWTARATVDGALLDDVLLADMAEAVIGRDGLSEAEASAIHVLRREAGIDAASPFVADGAGMAFNRRTLGAELARIATENPAAPRLAGSSAAQLRSGTAAGSGVVPNMGTIEVYMGRVREVESAGDDAAPNARSSATGRYQFTESTWLAYYKQRFGTGGLSEAQILAKRGDGRLQDVLMRDLTENNAAFLRSAGEAVTPGNLYLVHFAGPGGARKLFDAEPGASAAAVLGEAVVNANPFLRRMSAQEVLSWADRKMGDSGNAVRGGGPVVRDDLEIGAVERRLLQDEIDVLHAESARIQAEIAGGSNPATVRAIVNNQADAVPVDFGAVDIPARSGTAPLEPRAFDPDAPEAEVLALLPQLRQIVGERSRSLNQIGKMAEELSASEAEVRRGLTVLVREGSITANRKSGNFMRKPPPLEGPQDVLDFIARHGGIRDDEGHALGLVRQEGRFAGRRDGMRDWQRLTRRNGPLLRRAGRSLDEIGELLGEAGYLRGRDSERPSITEVLAFLDQRIGDGKPRYSFEDQASYGEMAPERAGSGMSDEEYLFRISEIEDAAAQLGLDPAQLDPEFLDFAARAAQLGEQFADPAERLLWIINSEARAARLEFLEQTDDLRYEDISDEWPFDPFDPAEAAGLDAGGAAGRGADPATAGTGGPDRGAIEGSGATGPALAELPHEEVTRFLDPDGPEARAQLDSLDHDARVATDPFAPAAAADSTHSFGEQVAQLAEAKRGSIIGALDHAETGPIDVVWGRYDPATEVGFGMAKIIGKHEIEPARLPELIAGMKVIESGEQRIVLGGDGYRAIISRDWQGEPRDHWLLTAYERNSPPGAMDQRAPATDPTGSSGRGEGVSLAESAGSGNQDGGVAPDPAIAARQAEEARLRAEAPLRGANKTGQAQDGVMGSPLFDAVDSPEFRLDAEGPVQNLKAMIDEFDAEAAEIRNTRDCL